MTMTEKMIVVVRIRSGLRMSWDDEYTLKIMHLPTPNSCVLLKDTPEKRKMMLYGSFFTRSLWSITYAAQSQAQCFECMRVCPVGKAHRTKR